MERRGRQLAAALGGHMHWERQFVCLCMCLHMHAPRCMALTTTTCAMAHMLQSPDGNSSPSWCNWTVFHCNTRDYNSCLPTCTSKTLSRGGKACESLSHTAETFLLLPMNTENARCRCKVRARMHGLNEKRCESEWCPPFWILISSSDISTHHPPLFSTSTNPASSHPFLPRSFPSHRSVLETGYEGLCYLITDQRARENEWGRKTKEKYVRDAKRGRNWTKWDGEDGNFFHSVFFIHLLFWTVELLKLHGPNWTNDWA